MENEKIIKNKVGFIEIQEEMLVKFWKTNKFFIPLRIDTQEQCNNVKYLMYCEFFETLDESDCIPNYTLEYESVLGKTILRKITKVE